MYTRLRLGLIARDRRLRRGAIDWKALRPEGYVSVRPRPSIPPARLLVWKRSAPWWKSSTGAQMALVTIPTLEQEPIEDVANTIYRAWGVGQKGKNEGVLLLLVINDRRSRLEVGYGLEPILPDGVDGDILRQMRPALQQNDFGDALAAAAQTMGDIIAKAKNVQGWGNCRGAVSLPRGGLSLALDRRRAFFAGSASRAGVARAAPAGGRRLGRAALADPR